MRLLSISLVSLTIFFSGSCGSESGEKDQASKDARLTGEGPVPAAAELKTDRPRVLLRPEETAFAVSLDQLRSAPKDDEYPGLLAQLREEKDVSAQAMVWLLTGEKAYADSAIARMLRYRIPAEYNTFHIHSRLTEFGYAYDWLYNYEGFTKEIKTEIRRNVLPLAEEGLKNTNDHIFHNYVWMSGGGAFIWALATAGEDDAATALYEGLRARFNERLFPAWVYLDGLPSEPLGYWTYYVFNPGVLALLASQSASETDILGSIRKNGDWLGRQYANLIQSVLPDLRFIPWGDLQSGPNGGVTMEEAGIVDALAWALDSREGIWLSRSLAAKRGPERFRGKTAIYYMLYSRLLDTEPTPPPLSFLAGNNQSGHFIARSDWSDNATIVSMGCKDHFGDHHHYDQGGFMIYRNGLLAVDPPVYNKVAGPQQPTAVHNTLLIGGNQRRCRGQWFTTLAEFEENRVGGPRLETGDILFYKESGDWAATACQFAQAYSLDTVASCVRQLLFLRPGTVVVVDHLEAPAGRTLPPEVQWNLQLPQTPAVKGTVVTGSNGKSWLRCTPLSTPADITVSPTEVKTQRVTYEYPGAPTLQLVHLLETGDNGPANAGMKVNVTKTEEAVEVSVNGQRFVFQARPPFEVKEK